jgi:DNA-binding winged helix-turn-helix (wHTH) protein
LELREVPGRRKFVSKQDLLDIAWKGRFVSESPLTTTIAELREALEDDAKEPGTFRPSQSAPIG